jgi:hypothetical protein
MKEELQQIVNDLNKRFVRWHAIPYGKWVCQLCEAMSVGTTMLEWNRLPIRHEFDCPIRRLNGVIDA